MARNLALFAFAWAAKASVLNSSHQGAVSLRGGDDGDKTVRQQACQFCHRLCPISCFVGTCGMDYGFTVRKFEATNKCYSCDPATSVGVSRDGDFLRCESAESGASSPGKSPFDQQQSIADGPKGPAVPGEAGLHALKASQQAQIAVKAATRAAILADKAAAAATAKYRDATRSKAGGNGADFASADEAANHQMAAQIRAEESLRVAETSHLSWKAAMAKYNHELEKLRRQQIVTDQSEKVLEAAERSSEKARGQYAQMQASAQAAMQAAMMSGSGAAGKITAQAAAEELAGAAKAAHRRLVIAAKEAKDASEKIAIASSMAPCAPVLLQAARAPGAPAVIGCSSIAEQKAQSPATPRNTPLVMPTLPEGPPPPPSIQQVIQQKVDAEMEAGQEPPMAMEGELEVPNIEQQMTANLAEKLADNPGAVTDASLFSAPAVPFSSEQTPVDGTEQVPNFDLSTLDASSGGLAALQQGQRRMRGFGRH